MMQNLTALMKIELDLRKEMEDFNDSQLIEFARGMGLDVEVDTPREDVENLCIVTELSNSVK